MADGTITLRTPDGVTVELDAHTIPTGTVVILQTRDAAPPFVLELAREQLKTLLGDDVARRFLVVDHMWHVIPVPIPNDTDADRG